MLAQNSLFGRSTWTSEWHCIYNVGVLNKMASPFLSLSVYFDLVWNTFVLFLFFILQIKKENIIASISSGHLSDK